MIFSSAAKKRLAAEAEDAQNERKSANTKKEDKPCSLCGHLCSFHAPAHYTQMYCNAEGCSCNGYFPSKSYELVVQENIALRQELKDLKAQLEPLTKKQTAR